MSLPEIRPGQEWEKTHNDGPSSPPTRIRIVSTSGGYFLGPSAFVESLLPSGRWGRRRYLRLSALNNKPTGYRLVKDVP